MCFSVPVWSSLCHKPADLEGFDSRCSYWACRVFRVSVLHPVGIVFTRKHTLYPEYCVPDHLWACPAADGLTRGNRNSYIDMEMDSFPIHMELLFWTQLNEFIFQKSSLWFRFQSVPLFLNTASTFFVSCRSLAFDTSMSGPSTSMKQIINCPGVDFHSVSQVSPHMHQQCFSCSHLFSPALD